MEATEELWWLMRSGSGARAPVDVCMKKSMDFICYMFVALMLAIYDIVVLKKYAVVVAWKMIVII